MPYYTLHTGRREWIWTQSQLTEPVQVRASSNYIKPSCIMYTRRLRARARAYART